MWKKTWCFCMKRDDSAYLKHILDAIFQIEEYLGGVSLEHFRQTKLVQDAVIRELEIIGESSRNLSTDLCQITLKYHGNRLLDLEIGLFTLILI
jgi:uncharacterized protein with HEPN domain